jgi:hypothetical protein
MDEAIFFCQAPADLQYILSQIDKGNYKSIIIIVINTEKVFDFINTLNLPSTQLIFIPYKQNSQLFNPISIFGERTRLRKIYNSYFKDKKSCQIYYYSLGYDWITFFLLEKLSHNNSVFYVDFEAPTIEMLKSTSLYQKINQLTVFLITGIWFPFAMHSEIKNEFLFLDLLKYKIKTIKPVVSKQSLIKYAYKEKDIKQPGVLLLESNMETYDMYIDYQTDILHILGILKNKGFYVYVKPHPRLNFSPFIEKYVFGFIPKEIPAEFLDVSEFRMVLKTDSIASFASDTNNVYSILELLRYRKEGIKNGYRNKLIELDINNLKFIENETEFIQLLDKFKG